MKWNLLLDGANSGHHNMDFDIALANQCKENEVYLRFYQWSPYCISLGANQEFNIIDHVKTKNDEIDVVKRPTGGRAILHAEELTYSLIMPVSYGYKASEIYKKVSNAIVKGLIFYNSKLENVELEENQPDFNEHYKKNEGVLCFSNSAKSEIKYEGKKLVGSAQRKMNNTILQHGSILIGKFHKELPHYLNINYEDKKILTVQLQEKTIELETILNKKIDYERLTASITLGFETEWGVSIKQNNNKFLSYISLN